MTTSSDVVARLRALVTAACPTATVQGFTEDASKPERIPLAGIIQGDPGDPGEAQVDLSPLTYIFTHHIPVEICMPVTSAGDAPHRAHLASIGAAVLADRTLGGLCDFLDITAATFETDDITGATALRLAHFEFIAENASSNPLAA